MLKKRTTKTTKLLGLYLLTRIDDVVGRPNYDYFDSMVVAAANRAAARMIRPMVSDGHDWPAPEYIKAERIGTANARQLEGAVICASFNAG